MNNHTEAYHFGTLNINLIIDATHRSQPPLIK